MENVKGYVMAAIFGAGAALGAVVGGVDTAFKALLIIMAIDWLTGVLAAAVSKEREKLSSKIGFVGLARKVLIILAVAAMHQVDVLFGTDAARAGAIFGFGFNEAISIIENLGQGGVKIPQALAKFFDDLKDKEGPGQ